jgi:diacylglycerol kinase (ATP)
VAVLVNPTAGRGRHRELITEVLAELRACGRTLRPIEATSADDALAATRRAVADGASAVVAVGGDGTLHLALQAVADTGLPFGLVPAGTGNDFAEQLGLPAGPTRAAATVAAALREGRTRPVDLARMTGLDGFDRYYGAVLGAGFDAIVNERANAMRWPRGARRYDLATYLELVRLRPRRYEITIDGRRLDVDAVLVAVGNTASYGGGMRICPAADPTDGLLDVVVANCSRATLVRLKPSVYKGTHVEHRAVSAYRARTVEVAAEGIVTYVDGERACPLPVVVTSAPGSLTLLS